MRFFTRLALLMSAAAAAVPAASLAAGNPPARPRLVVLVSIDQFRADYLVRFGYLYESPGSARRPGGFRFLREQGAWYPDCRYEHLHTVTAAGHSILGTGSQP